MFTETLKGMNRLQLRSACRSHKVKGFSKMTVAQMRAALAKAVTTGNGDEAAAVEYYQQELAEEAKAAETKVVATPPKETKPAPAKKAGKVRELKRPKAGGACAAVWDWLDSHRDATVKDVRKMAEEKGLNPGNAAIEIYQFRKFHGITSKGKRS